MSGVRVFVDSNTLVYAHEADAGQKHDVAKLELAKLWNEENGALSIQVLQEFYVSATRKLSQPISRRAAREVIEAYGAWSPHRPTTVDLVTASELEQRHRLAFWDALIVTSAQRSESATLLSEDLQNGQRFGEITIVHPYAEVLLTTIVDLGCHCYEHRPTAPSLARSSGSPRPTRRAVPNRGSLVVVSLVWRLRQ